MNQDFLTQDCNRQDELLSVLYGEASAEDARQFQTHLRQCASCNEQYETFSGVRSSVRELRDQALVGFQSPSVSRKVEQKSARAALRAFFDLSPGWMKFGTAFATAALCVFGFITFMKTGQRVTKSPLIEASSKVYSEAELKDAVAKAVNQATTSASRDHMNVSSIPTKESADRIGVNRNPPPSPKGRRPLSRNERQQLAADLRLLSRPEDDGIELLSDRINQ
jgi:anti-sigma factor RsiW